MIKYHNRNKRVLVAFVNVIGELSGLHRLKRYLSYNEYQHNTNGLTITAGVIDGRLISSFHEDLSETSSRRNSSPSLSEKVSMVEYRQQKPSSNTLTPFRLSQFNSESLSATAPTPTAVNTTDNDSFYYTVSKLFSYLLRLFSRNRAR